ncbi:hypothetical protein BKN14_00805 [Candidatus Gracilibacteria bacterium HOT-871]|nr:hypothetical protein BKN14_00805 [Candidatus Gracilibacteria bacterium HOT-871]MBF0913600.1 hypothetical protein [Candidatus Gracilibacteria bacterium]
MNKFDSDFFKKYVPEGQELLHIIHIHPIVILQNLIVELALLLALPIYFYYSSSTIHDKIPFWRFEIYLFLLFSKIIYDIFNWYNDVWIITNSAVVALDRSMLKSKTESVNFENIEGLGVDENGLMDKLLKKGGLVIHKIGEEEFLLEDCINPYKAIDIIEQASSGTPEENNITEERFNMILEALSGVVGDHEKEKFSKSYKDKKDEIKKKVIENAEKSEGTVDLRE